MLSSVKAYPRLSRRIAKLPTFYKIKLLDSFETKGQASFEGKGGIFTCNRKKKNKLSSLKIPRLEPGMRSHTFRFNFKRLSSSALR